MATELDRDVSLQSLADSTALIFDRSMSPEKLVGQAWLISKGRVLTLASSVCNYTEAPWALTLQFPHPNVSFGVRQINLHPDFNKREARDLYLQQAQNPDVQSVFENDIATIILDYDLSAAPMDKIGELNRALQIPFDTSPQDMSGSMRSGDIPSILQSALSTGRSGLMTMVDQRNIPFARLSINRTRITRVMYNGLYNEAALCELLWKKPAGNFAFQPIDNYRWPADVVEMQTAAEQIVPEGLRRADELPRVIDMLGGPDVRFEKAIRLADFTQVPANERWIAERLWECFDGYLPMSKAPERICCDTYNTIKMIWDLASAGLITVSAKPAFHCNGQLGPMLVPAGDTEISAWDSVTAFYLDPVSLAPLSVAGNCLGSARVQSNKTLLHTASLPPTVRGAAIIKEGKLVGIHTGAHIIRSSTPPPVPLNRMIWVGALNDFGAKRLRNEAAALDGDLSEPDLSMNAKVTGLRAQGNGTSQQTAAVPEMPQEVETGFLAKFTKQQLAIAAGGSLAFALISLIIGMFSHPAPGPEAPKVAVEAPKETAKPAEPAAPAEAGDPKAIQIATENANFSPTPSSTWVYTDTSKITDPRPSFGMKSELKNLDILFIVWPNIGPMQDLESSTKNIGFLKLSRNDRAEFHGQTEHTQWMASHFWDEEKKEPVLCVAGVFQGKDPTKCIYWVAKPLTGQAMQDTGTAPMLIEQMLAKPKAADNAQPAATAGGATPAELATPEQLAAYRTSLETLIGEKYKEPKADEDADTKVGMNLTLDDKGNVVKISLKPNPNDDFNKALNKAFEASKPLPAPPHTKDGTYSISIQAKGSKIHVEEQ